MVLKAGMFKIRAISYPMSVCIILHRWYILPCPDRVEGLRQFAEVSLQKTLILLTRGLPS